MINIVKHLTSEKIQFSCTYNECFIAFVEITLNFYVSDMFHKVIPFSFQYVTNTQIFSNSYSVKSKI